MSELKVGFARIDITPQMGVHIAGYYFERIADGILDPLMATAVVFDDGKKRSAVLSADLVGINQVTADPIRQKIAEAIGTEKEAVMICCTHTHLGPKLIEDTSEENNKYRLLLSDKLRDVAMLAAKDLAPAKLSYTRGTVQDVAFVRRFRMKDGSFRTNPGWQNPDVDQAMGTPDENSSLLIIKRENAPEIGIVHFQVHPDVIGGCAYSADFPKFVRDTYEQLIENSRCLYINGTQGDTNHIDIRLGEDKCRRGYERAKYMGRKIAMSVIANYPLAEPLKGDRVEYAQKDIFVKYNKGRPDQIEEARRINEIFQKEGLDAAAPHVEGMRKTEIVAEARRIMMLKDLPDEKELHLTAMRVGDVVFAGFPGEPFTDVGRAIKADAPCVLALPSCCTNGHEGYFPVKSAYEQGGYEALTARYKEGTAETLIKTSLEMIKGL